MLESLRQQYEIDNRRWNATEIRRGNINLRRPIAPRELQLEDKEMPGTPRVEAVKSMNVSSKVRVWQD